jgi:hypothetical protein
LGLLFGGWLSIANADTYTLTDSTSITGDVISYNDDGVSFHTSDDKYTDRIPWTKFSQDSLKAFAKDPKLNNKNPRIRDFADPFIEMPPISHAQGPISIHEVQRLELPPKQSVIGGLFSSSLGIILIFLIYAANIYAGFEVAVFRSRPPILVAGLAAVVPIAGPIIFLCLPTVMPEGATEEDMQMETGAPPEAIAAPGHAVVPPGQSGVPQAQPATIEGVHIAPAGWQAATSIPETQVFQRGQFTFNRRFIETKFSSFFGITRHGADKEMLLLVKTPRGQYKVERITRIAANDVHFEVLSGAARQEVMVPFGEIQEIQLKHKNA